MYLFISNLVGMMLLAVTITILFKFIINYLEVKNKWLKFMILLATYTIILNHMSIEYLLYPESCVMCAGVLFSVIAAIKYLSPQKGKIYESFAVLLLSMLCYQGLLSIFPTIVITLSLLKNKNHTKKELIKFYIKEIFKLGVMYVLVMLISASGSTNRLERIKNMLDILVRIPRVSIDVLLFQTSKIPSYLSVVVMIITSFIIIRYSKNLNMLLKYILTMFTAYLFCMLPVAIFSYVTSRILMAIGATMGISLLFIINLLNDKILERTLKTVIISVCVLVYFFFNVINNGINGYEHLKAFEIDEKMGKEICEIVKDYEKNSGKEVKKFAYYYDKNPQVFANGILPLGSLTERKFAMTWCIKESFNYYCNKELEEVPFSSKVYYENFHGKDYTEFSKEQIIFVDDTLYIYIY